MADEPQKNAKPVTDEIATAEKDIDIFAGWLKRLENPDPTLTTEAAGKGLKLYDEVDRDPHAGSVLQTRYLAVVGKEWRVEAADSGKKAGRPVSVTQEQKIADFVSRCLLDCSNFTQVCHELLQAILYGFFVGEVMWQVKGGAVTPQRIIGKHPRRFVFTTERQLRLLTPAGMIEGELVPDRKFIVFTFGSSDNPYGKGLGQKLWWPVWFKKHGIKSWLVFLEKFGMPTAVGKYPPGTPPAQQKALLDAIDAIQRETGIKIPNTMAIEFLETGRAGKVTYETLCEYMDKQISKTVLGQTASTEGTPGKLGNEDSQENVREAIIKADADLLCECLNASLIKWIVDYNFPGVTAYPKLWIRTEAEQNLKPLVDRDKIIAADIGVPIGRKYFYDTYGIPEPEEGEELVAPAQAAAQSPQPQLFAEHDAEPDAADLIADRMGEEAMAATDDVIDSIKRLLNRSESLEEFRDSLLDLYGDMKPDDLGAIIERAMMLAQLAGRYEVKYDA